MRHIMVVTKKISIVLVAALILMMSVLSTYAKADGSESGKGGWQQINNEWYFYDDDGCLMKGWICSEVSGLWYYLDLSDGHMLSDRWLCDPDSGRWYYLDQNGAMCTSWIILEDEWYLLDGSGAMCTGWNLVNDEWYLLGKDGAMLTGWQTVDGKTYYLDEERGNWQENVSQVETEEREKQESDNSDLQFGDNTNSKIEENTESKNEESVIPPVEDSKKPVEHVCNYLACERVEATCTTKGSIKYVCDCGKNYTSEVAKLAHTEGTWITDIEATCVESGTKHTECTICKQIMKMATIDALGHDMVEGETVASTCTTEGNISYECNRCDYVENMAVSATGHAFGEWVTTKEAIDLEEGIRTRICDNCGTEETQSIEKLPHTHEYVIEGDYTQETCISDGSKVMKCRCGDYITETFPATGHTKNGFWIVDKEATCAETGHKHAECIVCGTYLESRTIEMTEHTASDEWEVQKAATETEAGIEVLRCRDCGAFMKGREISIIAHDCTYSLVEQKEATCAEDGYSLFVCSICSETYTVIYESTEHSNLEWVTTKEATETEAGLSSRICNDCGIVVETKVIDKLEHVHNYEVVSEVEAACETDGSRVSTCTSCGDTVTETIPAIGHINSRWIRDVEPTCIELGSKHRECTVCGVVTKTGEIDYGDHIEIDVVERPATCRFSGKYHVECSYCGEVLKTNWSIPATGHIYPDEWDYMKEPTCTENGRYWKDCIVCGVLEYRKEVYPEALGHDETDWIIDIAATTTEEGERHKECLRCGIVTTTETYLVCEHNYVETERVEAACETDGYVTYTCEGCSEAYTDVITATGHAYSVTAIVEATCETDGYTEEICSLCNNIKRTNEIVAYGHDVREWTVTKEAELGIAGSREGTCQRCGEFIVEEIPMILTDGVDSVYYFRNKDANGNWFQDYAVGHFDDELANEMFERINDHRDSYDKDILEKTGVINRWGEDVTANLEAYAEQRAVEITGVFEHYTSAPGENIAWVCNEYATVEEVFQAWKNSSGHNTNMLCDSYGYGFVKVFFKKYDTESDNNYAQYWAHEFYYAD